MSLVFSIGNLSANLLRKPVSIKKQYGKHFFIGATTGILTSILWYLLSSIPQAGYIIFKCIGFYGIVLILFIPLGLFVGTLFYFFGKGSVVFNNTIRLFIALFYLDEHRTVPSSIWQGVSRHTYEFLQTGIGYIFTHFRNLFDCVITIDFFAGVVLANRKLNVDCQKGMTLGNYIMGTNIEAGARNWTYMHEFGHTLQSECWGFLYLFIPALSSGVDMLFNWDKPCSDRPEYILHDIRWFETGPNRKAANYFAKHYGVVWDELENPTSARALELVILKGKG